ncbi:MAG TPA: hypothetical protein VGN23_14225 [Verrucomicrobiae bacterium]
MSTLMIVVGAMAAAGCSKSGVTTSQAAGPYALHGTVTNGQPNLPELQRELIGWIVGNHRMPTNFDEFAASSGAKIPPPPAGQKYIVTSKMHVQLVNQ